MISVLNKAFSKNKWVIHGNNNFILMNLSSKIQCFFLKRPVNFNLCQVSETISAFRMWVMDPGKQNDWNMQNSVPITHSCIYRYCMWTFDVLYHSAAHLQHPRPFCSLLSVLMFSKFLQSLTFFLCKIQSVYPPPPPLLLYCRQQLEHYSRQDDNVLV